jgi:predicted DNA-binding WGR domain protein
MKLIRQSRLYFREGNSDKVYEIDLCELSPVEYIVNFRYGRRGTAMKDGTKTPATVSREKAEAIFAALENEKRHKGYRSETEMFIDLPPIDAVEPDSVKGVILQRLQDAITGRNTFKTKWKTSRVIWKAGQLQVSEAIPYIMKLAGAGDELQTYAALWALSKLKAEQARNLFETYTFNLKQKPYLRNIACEALISQDDNIDRIVTELSGRMPAEIRYGIETADMELLRSELARYSGCGKVYFFADLYLLCKIRSELTPLLIECVKTWTFKPPYFRQIRALYKLAQMRGDCAMIALLSYRFEKEPYMFKRTKPMDSKAKQQIAAVNQSLNVGAELRSKDSLLAFSQFTKAYFQKNAINFLKDTGKNASAAEYLKLAVYVLLQFTEDDYSREEERPQSYYGEYLRVKKLYYFTLIRYPECSESLLLTTILFGNDKSRKLMSNLKFTSGKRQVCGQNYYYSENDVRELDEQQTSDKAKSTASTASAVSESPIVSLFRKLIGKSSQTANAYQKQETAKPRISSSESAAVQSESKSVETKRRLELYPEHWDAMPEAYIQLLMQARMDVIHRFAYGNLKARSDFDEICRRFDAKTLLALLNSHFEVPRKFGFETTERRSDEFYRLPYFVASMLGSAGSEARKKARELVRNEPEYFLDDMDFTLSLIFDTRDDNHSWINELLQQNRFPEERRQSLAGKAIAELLNLDNSPENNDKAINAIGRLNTIAGDLLENVGWNIVEQLVSSPLRANMLLAGNILIRKTEKVNPAAVPVELTRMFLYSELAEVRTKGVRLLNNYPSDFLKDRLDFLLSLAESVYGDVVEAALAQIRTLIQIDAATGDAAVHSLVYALMRKEKYEGAHKPLNDFVRNELKTSWNTGLNPKDIVKLMHSQYRQSHLTAYEILKNYNNAGEFTLGQIISFGNHEILAVRQWCYNYFINNVARVRYERQCALDILDSMWDDTREFAFRFFRTKFTADDWDVDTLIGITDSVRPDVENFGKELITMYFKPENAMEYLVRLSEHPSVNVQAFVTNYLTLYAADKPEILRQLDTYFRSVLMRVNKARVAKDRILAFLHREALKSEEAARIAVPLLDELSAQSNIHDKAACIDILTDVKKRYPDIAMHLTLVD